MLIDFQLFEKWSHLNDELKRKSFSHIQAESAHSFASTPHALQELTIELTSQNALKKDVFYIKGIHPYIDVPVTELAKKGCRLKPLEWEQAKDPEFWKANVERESLVFFCPIDDPILGSLYPLEDIRRALSGVKIIQIYLSHSWHRSIENFELGKFENIICAHTPSISVALLGGKLRCTGTISKYLPWAEQPIEEPSPKNNFIESQKLIEQYEQQPIEGCIFPLKGKTNRVFDRLVLSWEAMDSSAILEIFQMKLGRELKTTEALSCSLSLWGGVKTFDWLKSSGLTPNQIRGLLILDPYVLTGNGKEVLIAACKEVLKLQSGGL